MRHEASDEVSSSCSSHDPERDLLSSVFDLAVKDYLKFWVRPENEITKAVHSRSYNVYYWVHPFKASTEAPIDFFTFEQICSHLDLSANELRRTLFKFPVPTFAEFSLEGKPRVSFGSANIADATTVLAKPYRTEVVDDDWSDD